MGFSEILNILNKFFYNKISKIIFSAKQSFLYKETNVSIGDILRI